LLFQRQEKNNLIIIIRITVQKSIHAQVLCMWLYNLYKNHSS